MSLEQEIHDALKQSFAPSQLEVINESHLHAGHAGDDGSGESHWRVSMVSALLSGKSRVAQHRAVHEAIGPDIMGRIHALSLKLQSQADG